MAKDQEPKLIYPTRIRVKDSEDLFRFDGLGDFIIDESQLEHDSTGFIVEELETPIGNEE